MTKMETKYDRQVRTTKTNSLNDDQFRPPDNNQTLVLYLSTILMITCYELSREKYNFL